MRVLFDADPIRFPLTGVGGYAHGLGQALAAGAWPGPLLFVRDGRVGHGLPAVPEDGAPPDGGAARRPRFRPAALLRRVPGLALAYGRLRDRRAARALRPYRDSLYHGCNFHLPPFDGRKSVMLHDLSVLLMPETHPADRVRVMARALRGIQDRADIVLTGSDFIRNEAARFLGMPLRKMRTAPLAAAARFRPRPETEIRGALAAWGLEPGGYALSVGTLEPRKNLGRLLDAYEGLPEPFRRRWPLAVAGHAGWRSGGLRRRLRDCAQGGWCRCLGYVARGQLPALVAGAALFCFPSLYEGFGLPPLEAMQSGVPVVSSSAASLPEVVGDAGLLVDPGDTDGWREAIARGLEDGPWRLEASRRGLARAAGFTWERCARETAAAWRGGDAPLSGQGEGQAAGAPLPETFPSR